MSTFIDDDPFPPMHAKANQGEDEMLNHLGIYRNPNTRFLNVSA